MTPAESVIAKMRDWVANPKPHEIGTTRILAFPESDVRAMLEHIDNLGRAETEKPDIPSRATSLGGKLTDIDLKKEADKLKG